MRAGFAERKKVTVRRSNFERKGDNEDGRKGGKKGDAFMVPPHGCARGGTNL